MEGKQLTRRMALAVGAGGIIAVGAYVLLPQQPSQPKKDIFKAPGIGNLPFMHKSGTDRPMVLIAQQHPSQLWSEALAGKTGDRSKIYESNIAEVSAAALEAYDSYGINAILVEGICEDIVTQISQTKRVTLPRLNAQDTYSPALEQLLSARQWYLVADSKQAHIRHDEAHAPVANLFKGAMQEMMGEMQRARERVLKNEETLPEAHARLRTLRGKYQTGIDQEIGRRLDGLVHASYQNLEDGCMMRVDEAFQNKDITGVVVIYGSQHAPRFKARALQERRAFILAQRKGIEDVQPASVYETRVLKSYALPEFLLGAK